MTEKHVNDASPVSSEEVVQGLLLEDIKDRTLTLPRYLTLVPRGFIMPYERNVLNKRYESPIFKIAIVIAVALFVMIIGMQALMEKSFSPTSAETLSQGFRAGELSLPASQTNTSPEMKTAASTTKAQTTPKTLPSNEPAVTPVTNTAVQMAKPDDQPKPKEGVVTEIREFDVNSQGGETELANDLDHRVNLGEIVKRSKHRLGQANAQYSLGFMISCSASHLATFVEENLDQDYYMLHEPNPEQNCYLLTWGVFQTLEEAEAAQQTVPGALVPEKERVWVIKLNTYLQ